jgi:urease accessory protein
MVSSSFRSYLATRSPSALFSTAIEFSNDQNQLENLAITTNRSNFDESKQTINLQIKQLDIHQSAKQQNGSVKRASFSQVQRGVASIVAESFLDSSSTEKTYLTTISHKAPARVIPLLSSPVASAGAAVAVVSNYGGGLLPGDELQYNISCCSNAKVAVTTQGSNRIYKQPQIMIGNADTGSQDKPSRSVVSVSIEDKGTVVVAPDPVSVFTDAVYEQDQTIHFGHSSSFCIIDWISSGRYLSGERWQQRSLQATTSLYCRDKKHNPSIPILVDSIVMKRGAAETLSQKITSTWGMDGWSPNSTTNGHPWNAFASMLIYGNQMQNVIESCEQVQLSLIEPFARTRQKQSFPIASREERVDNSATSNHEKRFSALSGRVTMGISEIPVHCGTQYKNSSLFAVRFAAMSNEDLYRVFHTCLLPLKGQIGVEFYKDRIRASSCHNLASTTAMINNDNMNPYNIHTRAVVGSIRNFDLARKQNNSKHLLVDDNQPPVAKHISNPTELDKVYWKAFMLTDSALPTGSFAHSSGLEAINQLGIISDPADISLFVQIATKSSLQQAAPFIQQIHMLFNQLVTLQSSNQKQHIDQFCRLWLILDNHAHARLVSNSPACRASLDQGSSLFRVASQLMNGQDQHRNDLIYDTPLISALFQTIAKDIQQSSPNQAVGHMSTVLGIVTAILGLNAQSCCRLLGYCVARDIVSAAVRMNLLGPLASVSVLSNVQQVAEEVYGISSDREFGAIVDDKPFTFNPEVDDFESQKRTMLDQIRQSSSCAPLFDSIQPCHDVLSSRMFRS